MSNSGSIRTSKKKFATYLNLMRFVAGQTGPNFLLNVREPNLLKVHSSLVEISEPDPLNLGWIWTSGKILLAANSNPDFLLNVHEPTELLKSWLISSGEVSSSLLKAIWWLNIIRAFVGKPNLRAHVPVTIPFNPVGKGRFPPCENHRQIQNTLNKINFNC